ncbi:CsbD family protein [Streptomyces indicus]|uniref:CsbD-like n=1 Tax=Streptomyces indicus TaxID=417292 RepID=A0A1G9GKP8_9ACTN|nr:CsbD family protein [Streptomyces indicus]SDL01249.1 CsbD-like [Streptomyces indicus]
MGDSSAMDKAKGKAKEVAGKVTGNDRMEAEGKADQARGKAKEGMERLRDKAKGVGDSLRDDK